MLAVICRLFHVRQNGCVDVRVGVNIAVVGDPVNGNGRTVVLCNGQIALDFRVGNTVVKRQHNIRRFARSGRNRDICRTAAVCRRRCFQLHQHGRLFPAVFQRYALHQRLNALGRPVPFGQLAEPLGFDVPAAAFAEIGLHNLRHKHPHAGVNNFYVYARHRAEVDIHILKRLLHALADIGVSDGEGRLPAHNQIDVRAGKFNTAEKRDAKAARNLQLTLNNAVGADAEIHGVLVLVCTAERAQLDCGIYGKDVQCRARQIEGKFLRTAEVNTLVGISLISTLLPVELERIAEAVDDLRIFPQPDDADIRCLEGNFTGAQNDVACTLNQMHIGTRQRTPQLDGRDGEVVAVHGFCQILKTRAAAVKLPDRNGRHKGDAGAGLDKEPQLVGNE